MTDSILNSTEIVVDFGEGPFILGGPFTATTTDLPVTAVLAEPESPRPTFLDAIKCSICGSTSYTQFAYVTGSQTRYLRWIAEDEFRGDYGSVDVDDTTDTDSWECENGHEVDYDRELFIEFLDNDGLVWSRTEEDRQRHKERILDEFVKWAADNA